MASKAATKYPTIYGLPEAISNRPDDQCHWPIGDPREPDFHFCNHVRAPFEKTADGKGSRPSYCVRHQREATPASNIDWYEARRDWANKNPTDPLAKQIIRKLAKRHSL